jgi:hypothetical protein
MEKTDHDNFKKQDSYINLRKRDFKARKVIGYPRDCYIIIKG